MPRRRRPPRPGALTELPPLRILSQIAALQALYYLASLVLVGFATVTAGTPFGLDLVFGWEAVRGDTVQGFLMAFLSIMDGGLAMALAIIVIVTRSRLVPDFALTMHGIHLVVATLYTGLVPRNVLWWLSMAVSAVVGIWLATWGCRYRELRPISFGSLLGGGNSGGDAGPAAPNSAHHHPPGSPLPGASSTRNDEESEVGFGRGGRRGRGRDGGGGEYELAESPGRTRR